MKNAVSLLVDETNVVSLIDEAKQSEKYEMASFLQDHVETKFPGILTNEKTFLTRTDSEFVIENGVLVEYTGNGGDVVIPDGVTTIKRAVMDNDELLCNQNRIYVGNIENNKLYSIVFSLKYDEICSLGVLVHGYKI